MTIGSLFSGIGGLELGLERAGLGPVVWQVEQDPFCRSVLERHWPEAERFEDVRKVGEELAPVSIICGGFPCVGISSAGRCEGLDNKESALWFEFARIVGVVRPRFVVVENVSALLGRGLGVVLGDLSALGYDAVWDCIPAATIGAPHRRDRLFIVAWRVSDANSAGVRKQQRRDEPRTTAAIAQHDGSGNVAHHHHRCQGVWERSLQHVQRAAQRDDADGCSSEAMANADSQCRREGRPGAGARERRSDAGELGLWPPAPDDMHAWGRVQADSQPSICRVADGVSHLMARRRDKLKALGNAVVPQVAEVIGRVVMELADI